MNDPNIWQCLDWDSPLHLTTDEARGVIAPDLTQYQNPFDWPAQRKLTLLWISTVSTGFTAYCSGMYAPAVGQLTREFGASDVTVLVGITLFTIGFAIAPMILAPFSEINGRRPMFVTTGLLWLIFQISCASTHTLGGLLVARFLAGCASSTFSTMVGGVIADIYRGENRNKPMTLFTGGVLSGTGLGPLVSGFICTRVSWRWVFWSHTIVVSILMVLIYFFFYESRGSVVLSKKAKIINAHYERCEKAGIQSKFIRWKVISDEERTTVWTMIRISVARPFILLVTEPIVTAFSLFVSFSWAVLYLTFSAIPYVFERTYDFPLDKANAVFASLTISAVLITILSIWQEPFADRRGWLNPGPEQRLFFCTFEALAMPVGLFIFGWAGSTNSVHWIVPTIGIGIATIGIFQIYLSTFNYLADAYGPYASSAIAAQSFCRNILGGAFPLFTTQMYDALGIGLASSMLGGIAVVLSTIPFILFIFGPKIRSRSKICIKLMETF